MTKMFFGWLALTLALVMISPPARAGSKDPDAIVGIWHTTDDKSEVRIFKRGGKYFGQVASLKEPNWPANSNPELAGKPRLDIHNPNPQLRQRSLLGLEFMMDFVYAGKNRWDNGKVYDPESGKTYHCKLTLESADKLEVRGYVGFSLFGRSVAWTR